MEKPVVRETKFRHVYSKTCRKEVSVWNVKPGNESLLKTNGVYWALPWATVGGGSVGVFPVSKTGKLPDAPLVLSAHAEPVMDLEWSPLEAGLLATGSRENVIKLWQLPTQVSELDAYLTRKPAAAMSLSAHSKRPALMKFHPIASNILLTTSFDLTAKVWDLETGQEARSLPIADSSVTSVSWNDDGKLFAVATAKDKTLRLYDPRASNPLLKETVAHEGAAKGFQVCFLEGSRVLTVGFSAKSERQLSLWDTSADFSKPTSCQTIDVDSSLLYPYYEPGTGLLFLTGRGASMIFYEINNEEPYAHFVNKASLQGTYSVAASIPKRFCEVNTCEIARFLKLSTSTVDTVSFIVPRKSGWFQEDIYPPVPSGEPGISGKEWLAGKNAPPSTVSLKPEGAVSVFDVPEEEGGKNRRVEETKRMEKAGVLSSSSGPSSGSAIKRVSRVKGGKLIWESRGWFRTTLNERWVIISSDAVYVFPNEESAIAQFSIPLNLLSKAEKNADIEDRFFITTSEGQRYDFIVPPPSSEEVNYASRDVWIDSILQAKAETEFPTAIVSSAKPEKKKAEADEEEEEIVDQDTEGPLEGWLLIHNQGWFFESWPRRWFVFKKGENILYSYPSKETTRVHHIDNFHLSKTIAIVKTENVSYQQWTFKVCSLNQVSHFAAESEVERDYWVRRLEYYRRKQQLETEFGSGAAACLSADIIEEEGSSQRLETYIFKKGMGVFGFGGRWQRLWMAAVGKEIIYYAMHTGQQALERMSISMVTAVAPTRGNDKGFELRLNDGKVVHHLAESVEDRDRWIAYVENKRRQFVDLLTVLGIDEANLESAKDIESAPNAIDPVEVKNGRQKLLIQVVGKRRIRIVLVPLSIRSLNSHSAYVLDAGMKIYRWNGKNASRVVKAKAMDVATKLRMKERGGKADIIVLDQGKSDSQDTEFWKLLGAGAKREEIKDDADITIDRPPNSRLYLVAPKDEERPKAMRVKMIHEGSPPPKEMLDTQNVYVLDTDTEVFVWVGKTSKSTERKLALNIAKKLSLSVEEGSAQKFITRVFENGETILFKEKFLNYPGMLPISTQKQTIRSNVANAQIQEPIDVAKLHSATPAITELIDDGSGSIEMWVIEGHEKVHVDDADLGHLFAGESYIVLYRYKKANKDCAVIYFWQGRDSTRNEKGTSAYLTIDLNEKLGSAVQSQLRVVQNKEQPHFLLIFKKLCPQTSGFITYLGKRQQNVNERATLLEVIGDSEADVRTQEVPLKTSSLNTLHCYILDAPQSVQAWIGRFSSQVEQKAARASAAFLAEKKNKKVVEFQEGDENPQFWTPLGGEGEYLGNGSAINAALTKRYPLGWPKFFVCSNASGSVKIERLFDFSLEDMDIYREHVLIVDTFYEVYVWITSGSFALERKMAMESAIEYVAKSPHGHPATTPIWVTHPYQEPPGFTAFISGWAPRPVPENQASKKEGKVLGIVKLPVNEVLKDYTREVYTLDELKKDPLPVGVDPKRLETYLSDKEFEAVLKMTKEEFFKLPKWRADVLKNEVGLL